MSNASLKEQLQAVAAQFSHGKRQEKTTAKKTNAVSKPAPSTIKKTSSSKPASQHAKPQNKPKPKWLDYVHYGVDLLKTHFPACFKNAQAVKPLKKGIKQDLVQRLSAIETIATEDKACMVKSLSFYVNTLAYHKSVVVEAARIDLDGNAAGVVTQEEATYSQSRQQAKLDAKKARITKPVAATVSAPKQMEEVTEYNK